MNRYLYYRRLRNMSCGDDCDGALATAANGQKNENPPCSPDRNDTMRGFPLAMAYVPKQYYRNLYKVDEALAHGTLFSDLFFPLEIGGGKK